MMITKKHTLFSLGIITTTIILFTSFDSQDVRTTINNAIKNGNAGQLASHFNSTVEMSVLGNEGYFSKSQATSVLSEFFKNNPPQSFDVKQGGSTTENTKFSIGNYKTNAGLFKIYYVVKKENNTELIHKFTIEKK